MPLDVYPQSPITTRETGVFWVPFLVRDKLDAPVLRAGISSWDLRVYDEGSQTPEVPIFSSLARLNTALNGDGSNIWETAVVVSGLSRTPSGHTFAEQYIARYPQVGGKTYIHEYTFVLESGGGTIIYRQQVLVEPAYQ